ncbi:DUF4179 domain-containing protein [Clostridium sp. ZBS3]|uniref:DUF4179 domain-containing protein n=1 Tax=Clostridium sp. ZBS3 TaxID=2949975 RepID=UPI0013C55FC3|nr:DUF4179 domain-containing protein [Clostridium sp. ZBS3]NFH89873.1 DUF4179 domain-containing protein [Clostridium botulinum]NFI18421.1 DUF4179 domain-containing protein [Clostridium botulinum]NFI51703.1 DUF4179 domain-containing protein [Clostridium botulinum]NFL94318.1 DUF4179 domain-containing protein [Clostridium botulinum]NFN19485.1 DUF4179 domain-containing protein [Clostridium botulinum]
MKNDIYDMLNEVNINIDDYERHDFNDLERKKIKSNFKKSISKKKPRKKGMIAGVAIAALTIGMLGSNIGVSALSKVSYIISNDIAGFLGIERNLDEYKTVINKSITDKGITVQLNEVILDGDEMTVSCNVSSDKKLKDDESVIPDCNIYINGKKMSTGAGGGAKNIDDYTTQSVLTYNLKDKDLTGDLNIKISCSEIMLNDKFTKGKWNFEFKTNGDQLRIDTKEILLNNKFTLENGTEYTLEKYTDNSLGEKIYASINHSNGKSTYAVDLKGSDDLGNKVEFYLSHGDKNSGLFKIETIHGNLNENAKLLKLTPYAAKYPENSGKMDGEYKQVGEEFTIDLSKLK